MSNVNSKKLPLILYFIDGPAPKPKDIEAASKLSNSAHVVYRNSRVVPDDGTTERCDGVAGSVPKVYSDRYPSAAEAIKAHQQKVKALAEKVGDETPPVVTEQTADTPDDPAAPVPPVTAPEPAKAPETKPQGGKAPAWKPQA